MGRTRSGKPISKSYTLPSSPSHSSSSDSDFEFTISISPRKSSSALCRPADELFYKGQLLPLHLSPRISMVRTLLLSSSSSSSSSTARDSTATTTTTARDSTDSHSSFNSDLALYPDCDSSSSRPSSVTTDDDEFRRLHNPKPTAIKTTTTPPNKYSLSRFSSIFRNNCNNTTNTNNNVKTRESVKRMSATAKEVIRKYLKKVKPLYEKFSQQKQRASVLSDEDPSMSASTRNDVGNVLSLLTRRRTERSNINSKNKETTTTVETGGNKRTKVENMGMGFLSHSFSGNLRYPRSRRSCVSSCPSSMRSSPTHSGVLSNFPMHPPHIQTHSSSMEELQSAIQGAIAHCKNSLI